MLFLYTIGLWLYALLLRLAAPFVPKAAQWTNGRRGLLAHIQQALQAETAPRVWFHCASLGEFEQGRPLLEVYRQQYPQHKIVLTFFSPSGYEIRKDWPGADYIFYLPLDTAANTGAFLDAVQPRLAVFVKYEFWYYFLTGLHRRQVPTICVSAIFRPDQVFFKPWGGLFRRMLGCFTHIFTQNEASTALLRQLGIRQVSTAGDTRFDTVVATAAAPPKALPILTAFGADGTPVLVVGSSWPEDITMLTPALQALAPAALRVLVAPHELHETGLRQVEALLPGQVLRYSQATPETAATARILLIDSIGLLRELYRYGTLGYVGGAFGKGLHNTLEAAVFGLPLLFGPNYHKFQEAKDLIQLGGADAVKDAEELETALKFLVYNPEQRQPIVEKNRRYVLTQAGATAKIMRWLDGELSLRAARSNPS
ncbi:3-deoxy-D-manno-octulosonic-acid transferase [Hymenobacter daecheongensis DSM 21074]|uniref:3-deoxy-D-manno-octulosonic acid transferase n=1 Tax=Hymenobacter daecheongensis DSM 21074 TaxID=1121955 RepID=A0A1M6E5U8_9BACT|nr:glycosyltransferase N-terminal domain-containing protein [Hymenobacter daecheongensis]SHI80862.1 3-deoxy-D-manno-octulosonic-acid transferase [Hymenobacter daecheongensis DSM 21074]